MEKKETCGGRIVKTKHSDASVVQNQWPAKRKLQKQCEDHTGPTLAAECHSEVSKSLSTLVTVQLIHRGKIPEDFLCSSTSNDPRQWRLASQATLLI